MNEFVYVRFWRRVLAKVLDVLITGIPVAIAYTVATHASVMLNSLIPFLIYIILAILTVMVITTRFGGTPGKLILKMKIIDRDGNHIKYSNAFMRTICYMSYLIVMSLILKNGISEHIDQKEINHYINNYPGPLSFLLNIIIWFTIIDELFVLFNKKKRTIHDFFGKSYLVDLRPRNLITSRKEEQTI